MMSFSPKTGAAVLRYSMAMASARAETLYCEPGSRAACAAGPTIAPVSSPPARAAAATATARRRRVAMGSDPQGGGEDLLLAAAHRPRPLGQAFTEAGEGLGDRRDGVEAGSLPGLPGGRGVSPRQRRREPPEQPDVVLHRQGPEDPPPLGDVADPGLGQA